MQLPRSNLPPINKEQYYELRRAKYIFMAITVTPVQRCQFDLSFQEFHDGLALRYKRSSLHLPINCDGGGGSYFSVERALDCEKKGLVT